MPKKKNLQTPNLNPVKHPLVYTEQVLEPIKQEIERVSINNSNIEKINLELRTRLLALENILVAKGVITNLDIPNEIFDIYNGILNFQRVEGPVQLGDAVFILISSKVVTPFRVENVGSGNTLGRDIEDQLIGMNLEEEKEVEENGNKYKITMKKISREAEFIQPPEKKEENNENKDGK